MKKEKTHPIEEETKGKKKVLNIDLERKPRTGTRAGTNDNSCPKSWLIESLSINTWNVGANRYHDFSTNTSSLNNLSPSSAHGSNGRARSTTVDSGLSKNSIDLSLPRATAVAVYPYVNDIQ